MHALTLDLSEIGPLTDKQLYRLCASNKEIHIERLSTGELIAMSPSGTKSGSRHARFVTALGIWNEDAKGGVVVDSSAGFSLKNGAMRAPDAGWIRREVWNQFTDEQLEEFIPACPDFVCEFMSPSDSLFQMQEKMEEWIANGCRLGVLINPKNEKVSIYRATGEVEVINSFDTTLSGEDVLPGFEFDLRSLRNI